MSSTNGEALRVGGYCRTSGEGQRDNVSIPDQKKAIQAFCKANGWTLVYVYVDECKSGAKIDGREEFKRMLQAATRGEFDIVVPFDATRFARDGVDIVDTAKMLKSTFGIFVVDTKGQFDNRSHRNTLANFVHAGVSEHERLSIMERMLGARVSKAKAGLPWCGHPPFGRGWRKLCVCKKKCQCAVEWFVDERGQAMKHLLERYVKGEPMRELAKEFEFYSAAHVLNLIRDGQLEKGEPSPAERQDMQEEEIADRRYQVRFYTPEIDIDLKVPVPALPAIIPLSLHKRVVDRMNHNRNWPKQGYHKYILSGFLRCAECGYALVAKPVKETVYYAHHRHSGSGKACNFRRIPAAVIEGPVLDYLYHWFVDQPAFDLSVKLALPSSGEREERVAAVRTVDAELAKVNKDIATLVDAILAGADVSLLKSKQDELKARKESLEPRLQVLRGEVASLPDPVAVRQEAESLRARLAREHMGKDWRQEKFEDVVQFLHFLFGDNPKKEGLGVYVNRKGGQWLSEIRARLRLRSCRTPVLGLPGMLYGHDGIARLVSSDNPDAELTESEIRRTLRSDLNGELVVDPLRDENGEPLPRLLVEKSDYDNS